MVLDTFKKTKEHFNKIDIVINIVKELDTDEWQAKIRRNIVSSIFSLRM